MAERSLKVAIEGIMAAKRAARPGHPSPGELLSYHGGELRPQVMEEVREHLAICLRCAHAVVDMASFPEVEPRAAASRVAEGELPRRWEKLRKSLRQETGEVKGGRPQVSRPDFGGHRHDATVRYLRMAVAALLVAAVGLTVALVAQRRARGEGAAGPRLNLVIAELVPIEDAAQRAGESLTVRLPDGSDGAVLTLALLEPEVHPRYEVHLQRTTDPADEVVWRTGGLERTDEGIFVLELPREFLPAGSYLIRLRGVDGERSELVATYSLELRYE